MDHYTYALPFMRKYAGILCPTFALRNQRPDYDLGIGDTESRRETIRSCANLGFAILQDLPINETGNPASQTYTAEENSPYTAEVIALEPSLLAMIPNRVPGLNQAILNHRVTDRVRQAIGGDFINYAVVKPLKLAILRDSHKNFRDGAGHNSEKKSLGQFTEQNSDWLDSYTIFRVLRDRYKGNREWPEWEPAHRSFEAAQEWLRKLRTGQQREFQGKRDFYAYVQWVAQEQWKGVKQEADERGVRLIGDMPYGFSRNCSTVWRNPKLVHLDSSAGAPPADPFFKTSATAERWGQNWDMAPHNWDAHREEGFTTLKRRVEYAAQFVHDDRLDHVIGPFRIYTLPWRGHKHAEFSCLSGEEVLLRTGGRLPAYLPGPDYEPEGALRNEAQGREVLGIMLRAAGKMGFVGEDLGSVGNEPGDIGPYLKPALREMGIAGFSMFGYERVSRRDARLVPTEEYDPHTVFSPGTHDHDPILSRLEQLISRAEAGDQQARMICGIYSMR